MPSLTKAQTMDPVPVKNFRADGPSVQLWHDSWRNADRVIRFTGKCYACGRYTWAADDGENDPRGVLGDHASHALSASDYDMIGPDVPLCAMCGNDEGGYHAALHYAERRAWKQPGAVS